MKRSGTVLMYNCSGPEFSKLKQIFAMLRIRMRPVTPKQYHLSLLELSNGTGEPSAEEQESIPESMLVFCGLGSAFLHQVLEVIRLAKLPPIPLKAVLTETNQSWTTQQLREELLREKEAIAAQMKEKASAGNPKPEEDTEAGEG